MRTLTAYLVARASGDLRITKRRPRLAPDEVAWPITVRVPNTWGVLLRDGLTLTMPEPPLATVTAGDVVQAT